jgi:hypothetical protein
VCVCVCVCARVCVWYLCVCERERNRQTDRPHLVNHGVANGKNILLSSEHFSSFQLTKIVTMREATLIQSQVTSVATL